MKNLNNRKRISINSSFFTKPTILNSYWAGFIAADGYINPKGDVISIQLSRKDEDHLIRFTTDIQYEGQVKRIERKPDSRTGNISSMSYIQLCGARQLIKDLDQKFNVKYGKQYGIILPKLPKRKLLAYIKGYIDGDGSIMIRKRGNCIQPRLTIIGHFEILESIRKIFLNIVQDNLPIVHKDGNLFKIDIAGKKATIIFAKLSSISTPELPRKWNKIKHQLNNQS
jgi:hypothetical protein